MPKEVAASAGQEHRALVLASNLTDGAVIKRVLADAGVETINYATAEELLNAARAGVGTIIITEEAMVGMALELLAAFFGEEPTWSHVPLIVLTAQNRSRSRMPRWRQSVADLPFVRSATLLERPLRTETLIQSVRVAMRSRDRQYQLRNYLVEREELLARTYTLFRELQHRVKNNLQVIQSLVRLSAKRAPAELAEYFDEVRRQIWAIGQAHHKLYAGGNLDHIDLSSYIADISDQSVIGLGSLNIALTLLACYLFYKKSLFEKVWLMRIFGLAVVSPYLANETGWVAAETGRQPWTVYGLLRTVDSVSKSVPAGQVLASIIMFGVVYALLFAVWVFVLNSKIVHGPDDSAAPPHDTTTKGLIEAVAFYANPHAHTLTEGN